MIENEKNDKKKELQKNYSLLRQTKIFKKKTKKDFDTFYNSYYGRLVFYNSRILSNVKAAEDIATDSIMKSLLKIDDYDPSKAAYSTWLFTISRNECIQYLNKNKRLTSMDKFVDTEGTTIKDFLKDDDFEIEEDQEIENLNIKKGKILKDKIKELKNPYRKVISLREIDKKSYRDITIELRKKQDIHITSKYFENNYNESTNILTLVDPETKGKNELYKLCKIYNIVDENGNNVNFEVINGEVHKSFSETQEELYTLITQIKLPKGNYYIEADVPFNMSTLKSQIRNGRIKLQEMVEEEFEKLDSVYL